MKQVAFPVPSVQASEIDQLPPISKHLCLTIRAGSLQRGTRTGASTAHTEHIGNDVEISVTILATRISLVSREIMRVRNGVVKIQECSLPPSNTTAAPALYIEILIVVRTAVSEAARKKNIVDTSYFEPHDRCHTYQTSSSGRLKGTLRARGYVVFRIRWESMVIGPRMCRTIALVTLIAR